MRTLQTIIICAVLAITATFSNGCATTPIQSTIKAEGVLITSVDTGMNLWHDRVIAGKATQSQIDAVHTAYDAYYDAQMVAKAAIEKVLAGQSTNPNDVNTANLAVQNAETQIINLLNQYIK